MIASSLATLASLLLRLGRLTISTIARPSRCHCWNRGTLLQNACAQYCSHDRFPPQANTKGPQERHNTVSLTKDLVFGKQDKLPQPSGLEKQPTPSSETPQAQVVAKVHKYTLNTPAERWRRRNTLTANARHDDESIDSPVRGWLAAGQEIVFKPEHRLLLQPPHQEANFKEHRKNGYVNTELMRSFVQILTTPTADTPGTTLLLHFDNKRYLVGSLAEGTQRAGVQMGARFLKVSECFLTGRTEWANTGGLIGMILTLADGVASSQAASREDAVHKARAKGKRLGVADDAQKMRELEDEATKDSRNSTLTLYGPPNLSHTLATARRFVFRKGMPIHVHEIRDDRSTKQEDEDEWAPYYADENIKVWAMSVLPTPPSRPTTPRKRSIDEMYERAPTANGTTTEELSRKERDQLTVKAVVSEMFNSSWRLDTLYETPLSEVKLPAAMFIRNPETNKIERYNGPLPGGEQPLPDPSLKVLVRKPWPGALVESLPKTEPANEAISYIIRNHKQRGKFKPEAAKKLKVEMGNKWSQLTAGNSVLNADGDTITPDMVLGPSKEGGGIAVVDLPDPSYIDSLINRPEWYEPKVMEGVRAMVWNCGKDVATDSRIHEFMRQFSNLEHVVSSPDYCPNELALNSAAASTVRLRKVDPSRYRVPVHDAPEAGEDQTYGGSDAFMKARVSHPLPENGVHIAARGQVVQLEPSFEFQQRQVVPPLSIPEVENEMSQEVLEEAAKAQEAIRSDEQEESVWASTIPGKDAEIITLGTGSALPSKYRNVSATLLRVPGWGSMLFDCGENTLGQLKRVFNAEELKQVLQELRLIFISHMHADHHLGTASVIKAWYQEVHGAQPVPATSPDANRQKDPFDESQRKLAIISEPAMMHWLSEYASIEDYGYSHLAPLHISPAYLARNDPSKLTWFIPPADVAHLSPESRAEKLNQNTIPAPALGLADVQAVLVQHCHGARAISLTWPSGFKVSYSGDCRPSKAFAQIGKDSTVCIHEATFDDELQGDARAKQHSTTSEALGVAQAMGARACVLTHFSQRYQKIPVLERANGDDGGEDVAEAITAAEDENGDFDESASNTDATAGPLGGEDEFAPTLPDQSTSTSTGRNDGGQRYSLPPNGPHSTTALPTPITSSSEGPAAVKFKLASDMKVCVAFDYMRVRVGEMAQMEKFTPALLRLFAEEEKEREEGDGGGGGGGGKKPKVKVKVKDKGYLKKGWKRVSVGEGIG